MDYRSVFFGNYVLSHYLCDSYENQNLHYNYSSSEHASVRGAGEEGHQRLFRRHDGALRIYVWK